jgi:hypothetical protein
MSTHARTCVNGEKKYLELGPSLSNELEEEEAGET